MVVPARGVESMRIPAAWKPHIAIGRLCIESPFPASAKRITQKNALLRNDHVAGLADEILIIHASADGHLEQQCLGWLKDGKKVSALPGEQNQRLWKLGVDEWIDKGSL